MNGFSKITAALAVITMAAAPAVAAQPSAARLSVAHSGRTAAGLKDDNRLAGGALIGIGLAVAAVVAVIVIASDDGKSASN